MKTIVITLLIIIFTALGVSSIGLGCLSSLHRLGAKLYLMYLKKRNLSVSKNVIVVSNGLILLMLLFGLGMIFLSFSISTI